MTLTLDEVRDLISTYECVPVTPPGFTEPFGFDLPSDDEWFISLTGAAVIATGQMHVHKKLLIKPIPKRYRFICDDPTPRKAMIGDWVLTSDNEFYENKNGNVIGTYAIFRREEIEQ